MRKKWLLTLVGLLVLLTVFFVSALADGEKQLGWFTYEIKGNGTACITKYDWTYNSGQDVYVPRMLDGYTVTEIGDYAFSDESIFSATDIPSGDLLGDEVVIVLPDTVTVIGKQAFFWTKITACNIPASVQKIGAGAFAGCKKINYFSVDSGNPVYTTIDGVLYNKPEKELVAYPTKQLDEIVQAFEPVISIPNGIASIGDFAFYDAIHNIESKYSTLSFSTVWSIKRIGAYAFFDCDFQLPNGEATQSIFSGERRSEELASEKAFRIDISTALEEIGDYAFCNSDIYLINLPDTLKSIGDYAFCNALVATSYVGRESRGDITPELILPPVTSIGEGAFARIWSGEEVYYCIDCSKMNVLEIPKNMLKDTAIYGPVYLPEGLKRIGGNAFDFNLKEGYNSVLRNGICLEMPASVEAIDSCAFRGRNLELSFPADSELTEIGNDAFRECGFKTFSFDKFKEEDVKTLTLPEKLKRIGDYAFSKVKDLTEISIPESVSEIGKNIVDRSEIKLQAPDGSYAALWASENGYTLKNASEDDTSWLNTDEDDTSELNSGEDDTSWLNS